MSKISKKQLERLNRVDESVVEAYLVAKCAQIGCIAVKYEAGKGFPDRFVLIPSAKPEGGRLIFVETKALDGIISPLQRIIHKRLRKMGFLVYVIWTKQQVKEFINEITERFL